MKEKLKNIFFNTEITWKVLIIYSVICGVITGIIPLFKILDNTSIHNIAVCFEAWVLLALFVILNSKKPLEAGIKTFIFFLISQPLCYLVQVPFYRDGFGIFTYYSYWAKLTLLTFPGAMIAYFVKKENYLSILILGVAIFILDVELVGHFSTLIKSFPYQLLAVLFIIFEIILFINIIFSDKKKRIISYILSVILLILAFLFINKNHTDGANSRKYIGFYYFDHEINYQVIENESNLEIILRDNSLCVATRDQGEFIFKVKDENGNIETFKFFVENDFSDISIVN